ncbi:MAG: AraC family ligand binding domain-containing protein, partial [Chloroflexota bacterium]
MDKIELPRQPILGGTKNGARPQRYSYWRTGYASYVPPTLDFWVEQAGEYHTEKPFFTDEFEKSDLDQIYYHIDGDAKVTSVEGIYRLLPGDFVIIPKRSKYTYETPAGIRLHWFGIKGSMRLLDSYEDVTRLSVGRNRLIETIFIQLREVLILDRPGSALSAVSLVFELFSMLEQNQAE